MIRDRLLDEVDNCEFVLQVKEKFFSLKCREIMRKTFKNIENFMNQIEDFLQSFTISLLKTFFVFKSSGLDRISSSQSLEETPKSPTKSPIWIGKLLLKIHLKTAESVGVFFQFIKEKFILLWKERCFFLVYIHFSLLFVQSKKKKNTFALVLLNQLWDAYL